MKQNSLKNRFILHLLNEQRLHIRQSWFPSQKTARKTLKNRVQVLARRTLVDKKPEEKAVIQELKVGST